MKINVKRMRKNASDSIGYYLYGLRRGLDGD
jgi:hypothetical protein